MGKGEVVIVVFTLALLLCVGSVYCDVSMENANQQLNQAGDLIKDKAGDISNAAGNAMGDAQKASESWTAWAKGKLDGMGFSFGSDDSKEKAPASKGDNGEKIN